MVDTQKKIPDEVLNAMKVLNSNGHEAFVVGGCVRDSLLGREPKDWDIATSASPNEIKGLFCKTMDTGAKHGTVTVVVGGKEFEVTTFRIDGNYADNRHPESVIFTTSLELDLSRRDFTINAIAFSPEYGYVDPFNGIMDISSRIIRAVGDPDKRFEEDALRMLRAVRFSAEKNFSIDEKTMNSIKRKSSLIKNISSERIRDELEKILVSGWPLKFILLRDLGLLQFTMPEFEVCFHTVQNNPHHVYNVGIHTLYSVSNIERDRILRWTMLLHDIGKPAVKTTDDKGIDHFYGHPQRSMVMANIILRRLKFDKRSIDRISRLIAYHDRSIGRSKKSIRKVVASIGNDYFYDLLKVKEADKKAQNPELLESKMAELNEIKTFYMEMVARRECFSIEDMNINGDDLIRAGIKQGREIGRVLKSLLNIVIEDPSLNNKQELINIVKEKYLK